MGAISPHVEVSTTGVGITWNIDKKRENGAAAPVHQLPFLRSTFEERHRFYFPSACAKQNKVYSKNQSFIRQCCTRFVV